FEHGYEGNVGPGRSYAFRDRRPTGLMGLSSLSRPTAWGLHHRPRTPTGISWVFRFSTTAAAPGQCPCVPRLRPPGPRSVSHAHSPGASGGHRRMALRPSGGPSVNAALGVFSPITVLLLSVVLGATSSPGLGRPGG